GSIAFDPIDPDTLYVGTGSYSNTHRNRLDQSAIGIFRTTNANAVNPEDVVWENLGRATFAGLEIRSVVPTTNPRVILAAAADQGGNGGLFRSDDGGLTWDEITDGVRLPNTSATDLIVDPNHASRFYAALPGTGVFMSVNFGVNWSRIDNQNTAITGIAGSINIELATHGAPGATVLYVGVVAANGRLSGVFRDTAGGDGIANAAANGADDAAEHTRTVIAPGPPAIHAGGL
ncbi:MAG: hypothetical protein GY778_26740, partial [bacterium]|nr:hypothetical protein [bacterium]